MKPLPFKAREDSLLSDRGDEAVNPATGADSRIPLDTLKCLERARACVMSGRHLLSVLVMRYPAAGNLNFTERTPAYLRLTFVGRIAVQEVAAWATDLVRRHVGVYLAPAHWVVALQLLA